MFEKFTYKQKLLGLIVFFIVLFAASRKRSYLLAINAVDQVQEIETKLNYIESSTQQASLSNNSFGGLLGIGNQGRSAEDIQQGILKFSSKLDQVTVTGVREIHIAEKNGFIIFTNRLELEGNYNSLLKAIYEFEEKFTWAFITSLSFDGQENKENIVLNITFQSYEKA